jgi:hypothetical protein
MIVVTPAYREFSQIEIARLRHSQSQFDSSWQHVFAIPSQMDTSLLSLFPDAGIHRFNDEYFTSKQGYSKLLLTKDFYNSFDQYEFLMILQADAFITQKIPTDVYGNFDYIGAPWRTSRKILLTKKSLHINSVRYPGKKRVEIQVGNGGLSIRKIDAMKSCIDIINSNHKFLNTGYYNEDTVFATILKKYNFRIPTSAQAEKIFCEHLAQDRDDIPNCYGFHALNRYNPTLELRILQGNT